VTRGSKAQDIYTTVVSQVKDIRQYRLDQVGKVSKFNSNEKKRGKKEKNTKFKCYSFFLRL
jgi:hypothetical protein